MFWANISQKQTKTLNTLLYFNSVVHILQNGLKDLKIRRTMKKNCVEHLNNVHKNYTSVEILIKVKINIWGFSFSQAEPVGESSRPRFCLK